MWVGGIAVGMILVVFAPGVYAELEAADNMFLWTLVAGLGVVSLEGIAVSASGRTPGKFLLGLRVELEDGARPSYGQALSRAWKVWWYGLGAGLPIVYLFTMARAKARLEADGITSWDRAVGTRTVYGK